MERQPAHLLSPWSDIRQDIAAGQLSDARQRLQSCMYEHPHEAETWVCEALYRLQSEEWDAAEMALQQAMQLAPQESAIALLRAEYAAKIDDTEGAIEYTQMAIDYAQHTPARQIAQLAFADATLSHHSAQKALMAESHSDDQDDPDSYDDHDEVDESQLQDALAAAIDVLKDLLQETPTDTEAFVKMALLYEAAQAPEDALDAWEQADKLSPQTPDILHGMGRNLERLEYHEDAFGVYTALYTLEREDAAHPTSLQFAHERFAQAAQEAWQQLFEEWSLDAQPVRFLFACELYPEPSMLEESSPDDLFDPRVGLHVAFVPDFTEDLPQVRLIMYQRNIERDLEGDDETSLALAIEDLLEQCISRIFAILEEDPEDAW